MAAPPARPHFMAWSSASVLSGRQLDSSAEEDPWNSGSDSDSPDKPVSLALPHKASATASSPSLDRSHGASGNGAVTSITSAKGSNTDFDPRTARPAPTPIPTRAGQKGRTSSRGSVHSQDHSFSFTHITAPSPSSYPPPSPFHPTSHTGSGPREDEETLVKEREQAGWVRIRTKEGLEDDDSPKSSPGTESVALSPQAIKSDATEDDFDSEMVVGKMEMDDNPASESNLSRTRPLKGKEAVRVDIEDRIKDPFSILHSLPTPATPATPFTPSTGARQPSRSLSPTLTPTPSQSGALPATNGHITPTGNTNAGHELTRSLSARTARRRDRLLRCLSKDDVDIADLCQCSWQGVPPDLRPLVWPLLLGYLPLAASQRSVRLQAKRHEYAVFSSLTFSKPLEPTIWHQIEIDVPRTRPGVPLWADAATQKCLERILYVWAIKHPASGYVQGINDLVTPFFQVFLSFYIEGDPFTFSPSHLPPAAISAIEADSFWCLTRLLDGIQDNYIFAQPGIVRSVRKMSELVGRIDAPLAQHLHEQGVEYMQFAFRWMNCLLMREISVENTIRMWDTYLSEGADAFSQFHLFVCTAFLLIWSKQLRNKDFQGIIMFLQSLPTQDWTDTEIAELMGKAWQLSNTWKDAWSHLGTPG